MSRRSRRAAVEAFPALPEGIQKGLKRLVADNTATVSSMLDVSANATTDVLCEKCAHVMKQQQLSAATFLARFFHADILSKHATEVLQASGKGSAATLGDRIRAEWAKNKPFLAPPPEAEKEVKEEEQASPSKKKKTKPAKETTKGDKDPKQTNSSNKEASPAADQKKRKSKDEEDHLLGTIPKKKGTAANKK